MTRARRCGISMNFQSMGTHCVLGAELPLGKSEKTQAGSGAWNVEAGPSFHAPMQFKIRPTVDPLSKQNTLFQFVLIDCFFNAMPRF
jgi:hypothetical protein